ncbi:DUF4893 domain-containing protein [Sphingosinicella humi]|uniref:DUF4893 domain-containing protein n=1 Tax=Allosphingosinicella humi TaxID=2068657 RepID=A0A2U2J3N0_9SPHN|nr:DUF4893 domain-containing protein [Sphingosinicella humi]PWG02949.1 DUF4893 domain-containing protein [Sphingosinicella humi]
MAIRALLPPLLLLAACAHEPVVVEPAVTVAPVVEDPSEWRQVARPEDIDRLDRLDEAWTTALSEARSGGFKTAVAEEGELLDPDAALPRGAPPPGSYRCRVIKIGTQGKAPAYVAYKPFFCHVAAEGDLLTIVKQTGSQRPAGRLYPESDERMIFLGTMALEDETEPLPYGEDPERDMVGVAERVGPFRYRLVIPWPRQESKLDVFELVPATP